MLSRWLAAVIRLLSRSRTSSESGSAVRHHLGNEHHSLQVPLQNLVPENERAILQSNALRLIQGTAGEDLAIRVRGGRSMSCCQYDCCATSRSLTVATGREWCQKCLLYCMGGRVDYSITLDVLDTSLYAGTILKRWACDDLVHRLLGYHLRLAALSRPNGKVAIWQRHGRFVLVVERITPESKVKVWYTAWSGLDISHNVSYIIEVKVVPRRS